MLDLVISRRFLGMARALVALSILTACDRMLVDPAPRFPASLGISYTLSPAAAAMAARDPADRVRIQLSRGEEIVLDTTVALPPNETESRVQVEVRLKSDREELALLVELKLGERVLSRATSTVTLESGQANAAAVTTNPLFAGVALGSAHSCHLSAAGEAYCWGLNNVGQLGDGSNTTRAAPVRVAGGLTFASISAAGTTTCGLTPSGMAYCWGPNTFGQLGNGSTTGSNVPTAVAGGLSFRMVTVGERHTCGLTTGGAAYCWGDNSSSQVGSTTAQTCAFGGANVACSQTPMPVSGGLNFTSINAGGFHTCGLTTAGDAYCWGWNTYRQLGNDGAASSSLTPVAVGGGLRFSSLAGGSVSTCALTSEGVAYCWGTNSAGQLGTGSFTTSSTPVRMAGAVTFSSLSMSRENSVFAHGCGVGRDGSVHCWGANQAYQLGTMGGVPCAPADLAITCRSTPTPVSGGLRFAAVANGLEHVCGVTDSGDTYCWGNEESGVLGNGSTGSVAAPVRVSGSSSYTDISASKGDHTCALAQGGTAHCWGSNVVGELGNGSNAPSPVPVAVSGGMSFSSLGTGSDFSCALTNAGAAHCWGANGWGQLGNGTATQSNVPTAVTGGLAFRSLSVAPSYVDAISTAGVRHWWGQGGTGDAGVNSSPRAVPDTANLLSTAAGSSHTCVLSAAGQAFCRGTNGGGQLGNGTTLASPSMVPVTGGLTYRSLVAGASFTCGLTTAGAAYCWGAGSQGQLGNGATTNSSVPVAVSGGLTFSALSAGFNHVCGITSAGAGYCWGSNYAGKLGSGGAAAAPVPVAVQGGLAFRSISAGGSHSCGVTTAGVAYCWGAKGPGSLGNGSTGYFAAPVRVAAGAGSSSMFRAPVPAAGEDVMRPLRTSELRPAFP